MTETQKFLFDVRGYLLLPAVLSADECAEIKAHLLAGGTGFTGPAQRLLDHPAVVDVLSEILTEWEPDGDFYNFRCENSFVTIRSAGWAPGGTQKPHVVRPPQSAGVMNYQAKGGRIYSALTRVVWELNEVKRGDGGTLFLPGSHKANFPYPDEAVEPDSPLLEDYACPAGSVLIFTESLLHAATTWKNPDTDRVAIFNCYNSLWAQWHRLNLPAETIATMPEKRKSLFRGVFAIDFHHKDGPTANRTFAEDNASL